MFMGDNCFQALRFDCSRILTFFRVLFDSYDIGKAFLRFAEVPNAEPEENSDNAHGEHKAGNIDVRVTVADSPAEPVNNANHGIQGIDQAPVLRYDLAAETNRRDEESELCNKRNNVTEIAKFDVKSSEEQSRTERGEKRQQREQRKSEHSPVRQEAKADHQDPEERG
jgi:hypothetical protein